MILLYEKSRPRHISVVYIGFSSYGQSETRHARETDFFCFQITRAIPHFSDSFDSTRSTIFFTSLCPSYIRLTKYEGWVFPVLIYITFSLLRVVLNTYLPFFSVALGGTNIYAYINCSLRRIIVNLIYTLRTCTKEALFFLYLLGKVQACSFLFLCR